MKKVFIVYFILFFPISIIAQEFWVQKPSPTRRWLTHIQFVDTVYGWAAGDSGTIIHTSNSGLNWVKQTSGITAFFIDDLFFLNRRLGWSLSNDYLFYGTKILKTTDSGNNWTITVFPDTSVAINCVYFLDSLNGYLGGSFAGRIFKTTNGGFNWIECHVDSAFCQGLFLFEKANFSFVNSQTGFVCGGHFDIQGIIWKTTDSGFNWYTYCVAPEPLKKIKVINPNKIISVGGDFEYGASCVQTYNGGNSWIYDFISDNDTGSFIGIGNAIAFRTPSELWVPLGYGVPYNWAVSLDSGSTSANWIGIPYGNDSFYVFDATFVTPTFGWACDYHGGLLKYNTDVIGIPVKGTYLPMQSRLLQNYPNPFNPRTEISFQIANSGLVTLKIYDIQGKEVQVLVNEDLKAGSYKINWDASSYSSGVYFYVLTVFGSNSTGRFSKKMVVVK